jgi:predicted amidohydrolase YtcJ
MPAGAPGCERIDCGGRTIVPGFIDAHMHLQAYAESLVTVDASARVGVRSVADIGEIIAAAARASGPGEWVRAGGYREFDLRERRHPTRHDLDRAAPRHPVRLTHASGHAHVLNTAALRAVGITAETPEPEGGLFERDPATGEPTGVLYGMGDFLARRMPPLPAAQLAEGVRRADAVLLRAGVTCLHDASRRNDGERWAAVARWQGRGLLRPRVVMMRGARDFARAPDAPLPPAAAGAFLRPGPVKIVLNETTGRLQPDPHTLAELVLAIHRRGLQVAMHAVEENAIAAACAAIERSLDALPRPDHRHRIEHCAVCPPALAARLAAAGITVVTQPSFIHYHGARYLRTVPATAQPYLYPTADLLQAGVAVAGSSDCPIVPPDPLVGIGAAVTRAAATAEEVAPRQSISPLDALALYTNGAARAAFLERDLGSIEPGKQADLNVLSANPVMVASREIRDIRVLMTVLGGKIVARGDDF